MVGSRHFKTVLTVDVRRLIRQNLKARVDAEIEKSEITPSGRHEKALSAVI